MKTACIIVTNPKTKDMYEKNYSMLSKMSIESIHDITIYTYYNDESRGYEIDGNTVYFSYSVLQEKFGYKHSFGPKSYVGNVFLTLLDLYTRYKDEYDNYISYEDDVVYVSRENFFDRILQNDSYDVVFQDPRVQDKGWYWNKDSYKNDPHNTSYSGLLNLYIMKPRVIEDLIDWIEQGYYAHFEFLINQFVLGRDYKVGYLTDIMSIRASYEKLQDLGKEYYDVIHPVKDLSEYQKVKPLKTCVMSMIKDERRYLKEWIDYHLKIGFDDIFLFEDYGSEPHQDIVQEYSNVHLTKLKNTPIGDGEIIKNTSQIVVLRYFLDKLKKEGVYDWCLFTDIDEFLILDKGVSLQKLCFDYQDYCGLLLSWKMYNANGHIASPDGNVMDNYTNTIDVLIDGNCPQWNKKSFVNLRKANWWVTNHCIGGCVDIDRCPDVNNVCIFRVAWINHYFTKSFEDFCYRMKKRGNMGNNNRDYDQFFRANPELAPRRKELIFSQRYNPVVNTHYISREFKLISGGNLKDIKRLNT